MQRVLRFCAMIAAAVAVTHTVAAQQHLKVTSKEDSQPYAGFLRKVFSRIYRHDVVLSVICVPSFVPEEATGVLRTPSGYHVFSVTPSASVWSTEYHSMFGRRTDEHNREIRWKPADNIKEGLPVSYRDIKTRIQARPVSADLAERIKQLWQAKLLESLNPPPGPDESERYITTDGVRYQYSMLLQGHGRVTADGKLVLKNTPVWLMGEFSEAFSAYAKGKISEDVLRKELRRVRRKRPNLL